MRAVTPCSGRLASCTPGGALYAQAAIILMLHTRNTANNISVANISKFSKEANFFTGLRFLTPAVTVSESVRMRPPIW